MLERGTPVDERAANSNKTPLHYAAQVGPRRVPSAAPRRAEAARGAAQFGQLGAVKILLEFGADIEVGFTRLPRARRARPSARRAARRRRRAPPGADARGLRRCRCTTAPRCTSRPRRSEHPPPVLTGHAASLTPY